MFRTPKDRKSEIKHTDIFSNQMSELCMSERYSDVTFLIENHAIPAHTLILAARSEYFRALLFGGLAESKQKEIKLEVPVGAFKAILTYIYSGHLSLAQMREDSILDTLGLANQYGFDDLESAISDYLREILSLDNVCAILDLARLYGSVTLQNVCLKFVDENANAILTHESFKNLTEDALKEILLRDSFFAPEFKIFVAVSEWCKHNSSVAIESMASYVRFPLMTLDQLFGDVRNSGILNSDKLLDVIKEKTSSKTLTYRALRPEENVATVNFGALLVYKNENEMRFDLSSTCIINHIKISPDSDHPYSYFIDVSVDKNQWDRIVDYQSYHCRSYQHLYFPSRPVRYIKLVVTIEDNYKIMVDRLMLSAYYTAKIPKLVDGIVMPTKNVAKMKASEKRYVGINSITDEFEIYIWHVIGREFITIQLAQPYFIGSMRLCLYDGDERTYSFYITTSNNEEDWEIVVDKRRESCQSSQNFIFEPKIMTYIRIIGTHCSDGLDFRCAHFECPSQKLKTPDDDKALSKSVVVEPNM